MKGKEPEVICQDCQLCTFTLEMADMVQHLINNRTLRIGGKIHVFLLIQFLE